MEALSDIPDGQSYRCREYLGTAFIADSYAVPWFGETRPFSSEAVSNEGRVVLGFPFGRAFMAHEIVSANVTDQIKEESLHEPHNHDGIVLFQRKARPSRW